MTQQVKKHVIRCGTKEWKEIDELAFKSKNLYKRANYESRQHFFQTNQILDCNEMASRMQSEESYCALPRKVSQLGIKFNADINASYNIMRKVVPEVFGNGIKGLVVHECQGLTC